MWRPYLSRGVPRSSLRLNIRTNPFHPITNRMSGKAAPSESADEAPLFSSPQEERKWNALSDRMDGFHQYFKRECKDRLVNSIYDTADGSFERRGLSLKRYLQSVQTLDHHLTMHHTIEEQLIFPKLAEKLPQFGKDHAKNGAHLESHHGIHEGLVKLQVLVQKWLSAPSSYSPTEMRECLDSFRGVLFRHLDEEVEDLKGKNLKPHFTWREFERLLSL